MAVASEEQRARARRRAEQYVGSELMDIYDRVQAQERLTYDDAVRLYRTPNLSAVGGRRPEFYGSLVR